MNWLSFFFEGRNLNSLRCFTDLLLKKSDLIDGQLRLGRKTFHFGDVDDECRPCLEGHAIEC